MEIILSYLVLIPDYVWQFLALFVPGNKLVRFISDKLNTTAGIA